MRNFIRSTSVWTITILKVRLLSCSLNNSSSIQEIYRQSPSRHPPRCDHHNLEQTSTRTGQNRAVTNPGVPCQGSDTCSFNRVEIDSRRRVSYNKISGADRSEIHAFWSWRINEGDEVAVLYEDRSSKSMSIAVMIDSRGSSSSTRLAICEDHHQQLVSLDQNYVKDGDLTRVR
jgi:hypothetical protein